MKVSIITLTNNSEKNIHRCLESIHNQSYSNIEHIIIDNKSSDNTVKITVFMMDGIKDLNWQQEI